MVIMSRNKRKQEGMAPGNICDFCNKPRKEVGPLVEGPGSEANGNSTCYICRSCLEYGVVIMDKEEKRLKSEQTKVPGAHHPRAHVAAGPLPAAPAPSQADQLVHRPLRRRWLAALGRGRP